MTSSTDDLKPVKNRGVIQVGALLGVIALYFAASWAKERFIDPDRMLVGVHALGSQDAIVMFRDDQSEDRLWRIEKIQLGRDEPLWGHNIRSPQTSHIGNGMSAARGHLVFLDEVGRTQVSVTGLDLDTGEATWKRSVPIGDGGSSAIVGADRYVLIDGRDHLHVLDRETGKTIYSRQGFTQNLDFAYTADWIEILDSSIEYLELETGQLRRIEGPRGAHCRVGGSSYGFDSKHTLRAHNLATGESTEVIARESTGEKFYANSCGWQRTDDGGLRLFFADEMGQLLAIDLDPASPADSGRVAWTRTFPAHLETGDIVYRIPNRLDLVWSGKVPRFAPLEVDVPGDTEGRRSRIVVVDTRDGALSRQGSPGDHIANRFMSFKRGEIVYMVIEGWLAGDPGTVLAMDARTGEAHAVSSPGEFCVVPASVTDSVVWTWTRRGFSRQDNLVITVLDKKLQALETLNASRAPTADEGFVTSLLGEAPD